MKTINIDTSKMDTVMSIKAEIFRQIDTIGNEESYLERILQYVSRLAKAINQTTTTQSKMTKQEVIEGLHTSFSELKEVEEGKISPVTMEVLFNEL